MMIRVVLRKSNVPVLNEIEPMSYPRLIGLRLKCVRRKGLLDASQKAETLLESVADHFSKDLETVMQPAFQTCRNHLCITLKQFLIKILIQPM